MEANAARAVPVLMYHWFYDLENRVAPNDMSRNWISAQEFEAQMRFLHDNGYYYPSWQELRSWLDGNGCIRNRRGVGDAAPYGRAVSAGGYGIRPYGCIRMESGSQRWL